jgi:hypothetical protein
MVFGAGQVFLEPFLNTPTLRHTRIIVATSIGDDLVDNRFVVGKFRDPPVGEVHCFLCHADLLSNDRVMLD